MTNKVKVVICGKDFMLQTAESASYVTGLARTLDNRISEVSGTNSSTSPFAASIMVALSTLDDLNKANQRLDALREHDPRGMEILIGIEIEGRTTEELAAQYDITPNNVRNRLYRARKWLKEKFPREENYF